MKICGAGGWVETVGEEGGYFGDVGEAFPVDYEEGVVVLFFDLGAEGEFSHDDASWLEDGSINDCMNNLEVMVERGRLSSDPANKFQHFPTSQLAVLAVKKNRLLSLNKCSYAEL